MEVFLNQKRINVCQHTVNIVLQVNFEEEPPGKEQEEGRSGGDGGEIEWKLSEVNTRAVSRGQN